MWYLKDFFSMIKEQDCFSKKKKYLSLPNFTTQKSLFLLDVTNKPIWENA